MSTLFSVYWNRAWRRNLGEKCARGRISMHVYMGCFVPTLASPWPHDVSVTLGMSWRKRERQWPRAGHFLLSPMAKTKPPRGSHLHPLMSASSMSTPSLAALVRFLLATDATPVYSLDMEDNLPLSFSLRGHLRP